MRRGDRSACRGDHLLRCFATRRLRHPKVDIPEWGGHDDKEREMPQIIVAADPGTAFGEGDVTFRERVNVTDFESEHFAAQLIERLGWAVEDADQVESRAEDADRAEPRREPAHDPDREERRVDEPVGAHAPA